MEDWNPNQYLKFKGERTQPSYDLANRIPLDKAEKIMDIGCGPGNSTGVLAEKYPQAYILGADNSQDMVETAKMQYPALDFMLFDAEKDFSSIHDKFDIVFSNACIQWVPDHEKLLKNMMGLLKSGGVLAVQIPVNYEEPIHKILTEISASEKWRDKIGNPRFFYNLGESGYFDLLSELASDFTMWQTTYFHKMKSHQAIMEWYKSTGMRPYLAALSENDKKAFERDVFHEVVKRYPAQKNGEIIFRFPRLFFIASK